MRHTTIAPREIAVAARRNDKRIAHAASLTSLAATALENAAGDLSAAHGDDHRPLTGLTQLVLEEAARISKLGADIESHMGSHGQPKGARGRLTRCTSVMG